MFNTNIAYKNNLKKNKKVSSMIDILVLSHGASNISTQFIDKLIQNTNCNLIRLFWLDNGSPQEDQEKVGAKLNNVQDKLQFAFFYSSDNLGVIEGRNFLYHRTCDLDVQSPNILILDNDQLPLNNWMDRHLFVLNQGYDVVGVEAWKMNSSLFPIKKITSPYETFSYVGCGGMLISRKVTEKIGLFDPLFSPAYFEDPDFNFRAIKSDFKIAWNPKSSFYHIPHSTLGRLKRVEKMKIFSASRRKFFEKWRGFSPPSIGLKTIIQEMK
jgi:hypothetical protein